MLSSTASTAHLPTARSSTRMAVMDLGSNSFHLLVADIDGSTLTPVFREREMLHLGEVVARLGRLTDESVDAAVAVVERFADHVRRHGVERSLAVATSALRDARDPDVVLARLGRAAGTHVRVLDGASEARHAYRGARASIAIGDEPALVLDLGGGSLELAVGTGADVSHALSVPVGVGRLRALVEHDPPRRREVRRIAAEVREHLEPVRPAIDRAGPRTTVALGGTVRALARVFTATTGTWVPTTVNHLEITTGDLRRLRDQLVEVDDDTRTRVPGVQQRRADHLHVAAIVLTEALETLGVDRITISDWGLREGLLLTECGVVPPSGPELRAAEIARLRRSFGVDDRHVDHVVWLAGRLFDETRDLHRLGEVERRILVDAAALHTIGRSLALRRHHEHAAYILQNAELRGHPLRDLAMLVTLVRFHPSRSVGRGFPPFEALDADDRDRTRRLQALLQVADALDRERDQSVTDLHAEHQQGTVVLRVLRTVPDTPHGADWAARAFERAFGTALTFDAVATS